MTSLSFVNCCASSSNNIYTFGVSNVTTNSKILSRIQKLLNLARNNPSVEEAASAMGAALRLMAKHNLEEADIIRADLSRPNSDNVVRHVFENGPNYQKRVANWYNILVTGVGQTLNCHMVITRGSRHQLTLAIHGYKSDVMVAAWLVEYIQGQATRLADAAWATERDIIVRWHDRTPWASERTRFKENYLHGLIGAVLTRVKELYGKEAEAEAQSSNGRSLMLMKDAAIRAQFPALQPEYDTASPPERDEVARGYADASKVQLNKVLNSNPGADVAALEEPTVLALPLN